MLMFRTWKLGIKSLLLHPMRSALTILGIFIGVWAVIWLLAISEGISKVAQQQIEDLGADNIIIRSIQPPDTSGGNFRQINAFGVTRAECKMIDRTISTVKQVLPIRELPRFEVERWLRTLLIARERSLSPPRMPPIATVPRW